MDEHILISGTDDGLLAFIDATSEGSFKKDDFSVRATIEIEPDDLNGDIFIEELLILALLIQTLDRSVTLMNGGTPTISVSCTMNVELFTISDEVKYIDVSVLRLEPLNGNKDCDNDLNMRINSRAWNL